MKPIIRYSINLNHPHSHEFHITLTIEAASKEGHQLSLPAWIPGSYMIREFARNIVTINASSNNRKINLQKIDKHTWQVAPTSAPLTITYIVYAFDRSVRAAYFDQTRAFFNPSSLLFAIKHFTDIPYELQIIKPTLEDCKHWRVATTLPTIKRNNINKEGFGYYRANNYDELIDHPVEISDFQSAEFKINNCRHRIIVSNAGHFDLKQLTNDVAKICAKQIAFFDKNNAAPMQEYLFMLYVTENGYGGLEHRSSTALICSHQDLPYLGQPSSEKYQTLLGLFSHEYFHTWNVKRIKPAAFLPYDLNQENYTELLWIFEGFTSYYDDLMLLRSGCINIDTYLSFLQKTIKNVWRGSGQHKQSLTQSSFDAWIKYYRQDENAPNAIVSYYTKGSLIALCLDLHIRRETNLKYSLDHVMQHLWQHYGQQNIGLQENEFHHIIEKVTGLNLKNWLNQYVQQCKPLPIEKYLETLGIDCKIQPTLTPNLGISSKIQDNQTIITQVLENSCAQLAGLAAGDILVALDGFRISNNLDNLLTRYQITKALDLHYFREGRLLQSTITLSASPEPSIKLNKLTKSNKAQQKTYQSWSTT